MKGVYVLTIELQASAEIMTLSHTFALSRGFYAYVGSAINNLEARINRHLSHDKKRHWHIDFLLDKAKIRTVFFAQTNVKMECQIADQFSELLSVAGFGCSDCHCRSHLFYAPDLDILTTKALAIFNKLGFEPATLLI